MLYSIMMDEPLLSIYRRNFETFPFFIKTNVKTGTANAIPVSTLSNSLLAIKNDCPYAKRLRREGGLLHNDFYFCGNLLFWTEHFLFSV